MNALFAHETSFWLWLIHTDAFTSDLEWRYHANTVVMTENYSNLAFPPMYINER